MSQSRLENLQRIFEANEKKHFLTPLEQVILMGSMCKAGSQRACNAYDGWVKENQELADQGNEVSREMLQRVREELDNVITV